MKKFKILSIDGGGIKGAFPASFLASLESMTERPISQYFDLIAGTSTGGIIALGLGMGLTAKDLTNFYREDGPAIFPRRNAMNRFRWLPKASKWDTTPLKSALEKRLGDRKLGDSGNRLVVPSFNATTGRIHIYKTAHHGRLRTDYKESAVSVALATSAAPVFFQAHRCNNDITVIDGGIWANNPMGIAVVEAISMLGVTPTDIRLLSISCTHTASDLIPGRGPGAWFWTFRAMNAAMRGQSFGALGIAQHLIGHENVKRIDPEVPPGKYCLDNAETVGDLCGIGASEARHHSPMLMQEFFDEPAPEFTPCYSTRVS